MPGTSLAGSDWLLIISTWSCCRSMATLTCPSRHSLSLQPIICWQCCLHWSLASSYSIHAEAITAVELVDKVLVHAISYPGQASIPALPSHAIRPCPFQPESPRADASQAPSSPVICDCARTDAHKPPSLHAVTMRVQAPVVGPAGGGPAAQGGPERAEAHLPPDGARAVALPHAPVAARRHCQDGGVLQGGTPPGPGLCACQADDARWLCSLTIKRQQQRLSAGLICGAMPSTHCAHLTASAEPPALMCMTLHVPNMSLPATSLWHLWCSMA